MEGIIELEKLLKEGISSCYKGFNNYSSLEQKKIKTKILKMDVTAVPCLTMVNKFVEDNSNIRHPKDKGKNYYCIRKFCLDYILKEGVLADLDSYENRTQYNKDEEVKEMIRCYNHDLDQFWFMLQFLIYYVEALTTNVPKKLPSVREQLLSLAKDISEMHFNKNEWNTGYPQYTGMLSFIIEGSKTPSQLIVDYRALHYLSELIKTHLEKDNDPSLDVKHLKETREDIQIGYFGSKIISLRNNGDENKLNEIKPFFLSVIDKGPFEIIEDSSDYNKLALFTQFFFNALGSKPIKAKSKTNKWTVLSKLIYLLKYFPIKGLNGRSAKPYKKNDDENDAQYVIRMQKMINDLINKCYPIKQRKKEIDKDYKKRIEGYYNDLTKERKKIGDGDNVENYYKMLMQKHFPTEKQINESIEDYNERIKGYYDALMKKYYYDVDFLGNDAPIRGNVHKLLDEIDSKLDNINPTRTVYL